MNTHDMNWQTPKILGGYYRIITKKGGKALA